MQRLDLVSAGHDIPAVNPPRKLVGLYLSPWTERAKWALDHHRLIYKTIEHIPVIGERRLRRLVGPNKPRATVPVLLADGEVLTESWDIARYADRVGESTPLISPESEQDITKWQLLADNAMNAGRAIVIARTIASDEALDENAPPPAPRWLRPVLRPVTRAAMRMFGRKYGARLDDLDGATAAMRTALSAVRRGLAGGSHLLGEFSYADIIVATLMQAVLPVSDQYVRVGPANRRVWTHDALATEFADLIAWRDRLYQSQRPARTR